ncbi:uncharacterized protein LOC116206694 [Punica granatum]|uniref:Uncharacterized protein LOC116206694 n=1 Tax=Punica granatum TaxID=22663 RepID=A0A6P8DTB4_PUNGR|nr:uncharacterized protein LOC116206694 [Punica granatum]
MESAGSLRHPTHEHELIRRELWKECSVVCSLCRFRFSGPTYRCLGCRFFLDESCASTEPPFQIQHPFHPEHPLTLEGTSDRPLYRCGSCRFRLDVMIAIATLPASAEREMILHIGHPHLLTSFHTNTTLSETCKLCREKIHQGKFYGCSRGCMFLLHQQCAELPPEILHHPFHPQHSLTLEDFQWGSEFKCEACSRAGYPGPGYSCSECDVRFHVHCAAWALPSRDHQAEIEHFSHQHKLRTLHQKESISELKCAVCRDGISGEVQYCYKCRFFLHKTCGDQELPREIMVHPLHPMHPLILQLKPTCNDNDQGSWSKSHKYFRRDNAPIIFRCKESCRFSLDTKCALRVLEEGLVAEIQHSAHGHPLELLIMHSYKCDACQKGLAGLTYSCKIHKCTFKMHISCAKLPLKLQHPLHPSHPLLLNTALSKEGFICSLCRKKSRGFSFSCTDCWFYLDIVCATKRPTFKHPRHEHHLARFSSSCPASLTGDKQQCNSCGKDCGYWDTPEYYGCLSCNFNLHGYCLLDLPRTVQHECHPYHPLVLFDKFVLGRPDDQYCDNCEEIRNPDHGVYRCEECWYTVHIDCVLQPKLLDYPFLHELDRKITCLDKKIKAMEIELQASRKELYALKQEKKTEALKAWRIAHSVNSEEWRGNK